MPELTMVARTLSDDLGLGTLDRVDLSTLVERAGLSRRVDRKYIIPRAGAVELVRRLAGSHRVLDIDGRHATSYRSVYLDTEDLRSGRDHVQGRRLRWKARTRLYVEDDLCRVEVKVKSGRGDTVKTSMDTFSTRHGRYEDAEEVFVAGVLGAHGLDTVAQRLRPTVEVTYQRVTLADLGAGTRVTVDSGVTGTPVTRPGQDLDGVLALHDDFVIVETKGHARAATADRVLLGLGHRPMSFSKYAASAAVLSPHLSDHQVRRLLGRELHLTPSLIASHA